MPLPPTHRAGRPGPLRARTARNDSRTRLAFEQLEDRLTPAVGSLDSTFGTNGKVFTDFSGSDAASALALQPDGKIIAAGNGSIGFGLARYLPNGALDTTFGTGGKTTTNFF